MLLYTCTMGYLFPSGVLSMCTRISQVGEDWVWWSAGTESQWTGSKDIYWFSGTYESTILQNLWSTWS